MRLTLVVNPRQNKASWSCRFNAFHNVNSEESGCKKVPKDSSGVNCSFPPSPSNGTANSSLSIKKQQLEQLRECLQTRTPPCHNVTAPFSPPIVLHSTKECPETPPGAFSKKTLQRPTAQLSPKQPERNLLLPYSRAGTGDYSRRNPLPSKALAQDGS